MRQCLYSFLLVRLRPVYGNNHHMAPVFFLRNRNNYNLKNQFDLFQRFWRWTDPSSSGISDPPPTIYMKLLANLPPLGRSREPAHTCGGIYPASHRTRSSCCYALYTNDNYFQLDYPSPPTSNLYQKEVPYPTPDYQGGVRRWGACTIPPSRPGCASGAPSLRVQESLVVSP